MNITDLIKLIQPPIYGSRLIKQNQSVVDIQKNILLAEKDSRKNWSVLRQKFNKANKLQVCCDVYNFTKKTIPYNREPAKKQSVKTINRILADSYKGIGGDCKHYSTLIAGILGACGIPYCFKLVSYTNDKNPTHVYIVAYLPQPIILDCCADYINKENHYTYQYIIKPLN